MARRVVVTGLGLVTPLGTGTGHVINGILQGTSGIRALSDPLFSKLPCQVAGLVPVDGPGGLDLKKKFSEAQCRAASKATLLALVAAEEALLQSKLLNENVDKGISEGVSKERIGVAVGMGMIDLQDVQDTGATLNTNAYSRVSPYFIPRILPNLAGGQISIRYGIRGPNHCASTACATGAHAIGDAFNFIRLNYADVMLCGGTESSVSPLSIAAFSRLRALSTKFNNTPHKASRPYDKHRDGFAMAEGAGVLVIEEMQHAVKRGAPILGEILGYGLSGDGHHLTAAREDGVGALIAMKLALRDANLSENDISYINSHATSTPIGDKAEIAALRKLFNSHTLNDTPISSTKGHHGHLLGAAGAVETIIGLGCIRQGYFPPSINIIEKDPEFENIAFVQQNGQQSISTNKRIIMLKNSFGFGGTNASLCLSGIPE